MHGDWNRRRRNATTNSAKKKARILWTCYAIRWTGKRMMLAHGDGRRRRERPRSKWMDEIHEVTGMKLAVLRDVTMERKIWRKWSRQSLERNELTAQGDLLDPDL